MQRDVGSVGSIAGSCCPTTLQAHSTTRYKETMLRGGRSVYQQGSEGNRGQMEASTRSMRPCRRTRSGVHIIKPLLQGPSPPTPPPREQQRSSRHKQHEGISGRLRFTHGRSSLHSSCVLQTRQHRSYWGAETSPKVCSQACPAASTDQRLLKHGDHGGEALGW